MKVILYDVNGRKSSGVYKDFQSGLGTRIEGTSLLGKVLSRLRKASLYLPLLHFGYIAALLRREGHEVEYAASGLPDADWVIIHSSMVDSGDELELARRIREKGRSRLTFIGPTAGFQPERYLPVSDSVLVHEPEQTIWDVARGMREIPSGLETGAPVMDLDQLPFPDWTLYADRRWFRYFPSLKVWPVYPVLSSRGCAYKCQYCPYIAHFNDWRYRSPENVVEELEYLVRDFGAKGVLFRDPLFSVPEARAREIAERLVKKRLPLVFGCETRLDCINPDLIDLLYAAGLRSINVGIESTNTDTLNAYQRGMKLDAGRQQEMIHYCRSKGINVTAFYVFGFPEETRADIQNTLQYSKVLNTHVAVFSIFTPYPGIPARERVRSEIFAQDMSKFDTNHSVFRHPNLSSREIEHLKDQAYVEYYFRPAYLKQFLRWMIA